MRPSFSLVERFDQFTRQHGLADSLRPMPRFIQWDIRQDDRKFFAAIAGDDSLVGELVVHRASDKAKDLIAGQVPMFIVEAFEVVDVRHDECERRTVALCPVEVLL